MTKCRGIFEASKLKSGNIYKTNLNGELTIIHDHGWDKVDVRFLLTSTLLTVRRSDILNGIVKDYYFPSVFGKGFIGLGIHKNKVNHRDSEFSVAWRGLLRRCYDIDYITRNPTYNKCTVDPEWHNFQNFAKWAALQKYESGWQLDKDILIKGNKCYSPETCCFVPPRINSILTHVKSTNNGMPIGVTADKHGILYHAYVGQNTSRQKYSGSSTTPEGAFLIYKSTKEFIIKKVAEEFVDRIDKRVYNSLMDRVIENDG